MNFFLRMMAVSGEQKPVLDDDPEVSRLNRSLTACKSHFSHTEASNEWLVGYAPTVASPQTVEALTKGLRKLEDFFDKIHFCAESIVDDYDDQGLR